MEVVKSKEGFQFIPSEQKYHIISEAFKEYIKELEFCKAYFMSDSDIDRAVRIFAKYSIEAAERRVK